MTRHFAVSDTLPHVKHQIFSLAVRPDCQVSHRCGKESFFFILNH